MQIYYCLHQASSARGLLRALNCLGRSFLQFFFGLDFNFSKYGFWIHHLLPCLQPSPLCISLEAKEHHIFKYTILIIKTIEVITTARFILMLQFYIWLKRFYRGQGFILVPKEKEKKKKKNPPGYLVVGATSMLGWNTRKFVLVTWTPLSFSVTRRQRGKHEWNIQYTHVIDLNWSSVKPSCA